MIKEIPKSDISKRSFKTYKEWNLTNSDVTVHEAQNITGSNFDETTAVTGSGGYYKYSLWGSLNGQYYKNKTTGNPAIDFGDRRFWYSSERIIEDNMRVIDVPQSIFGEEIKRGTVQLIDNEAGQTYVDDTYGNLRNQYHEYTLDELDLTDEILVFTSQGGIQYTASISDIDFEDNTATITYNSTTVTSSIVILDFETNTLRVEDEFDFGGYVIQSDTYGNVFYDQGLITVKWDTFTAKNASVSSSALLTNFNLNFNSTKTIYETEIFLPVLEHEFNVSVNPSALEFKYDETNAVSESHIRPTFTSAYDGSTTATWDDYLVSASLDPTGSYLAPYITTIGLYDDSLNMVAVAKLTKPVKSLPDYPVNFIVRLDT